MYCLSCICCYNKRGCRLFNWVQIYLSIQKLLLGSSFYTWHRFMFLHKSVSGEEDLKTRKSLPMYKASDTHCLWAFELLFLFYLVPLSSGLLPEMVKVIFLTGQEIILGALGLKVGSFILMERCLLQLKLCCSLFCDD